MSGPYGRDPWNGLPSKLYQQAQESNYIDQHFDETMRRPACPDPGAQAFARMLACAIREARPVITLPPHVSPPWRAQPFVIENRGIIDGSNDATVALGASSAADAEGLTATSETSDYSDFASFTVPNGTVAVLKHWAAECDLGGYFVDGTGFPVVRFRLAVNGQPTIVPASVGLKGALDDPYDVSYVLRQLQTFSVQARSVDTASWHLIQTYLSGYIVPVSELGDEITKLLEKCP